jgi:hypothetical protein
MKKDLSRKLIDFDADLLTSNPINIEAARQRGWTFDKPKGYYIDKGGCLMADEYRQPF